jgi:hypothetical protein
VIHVTGPLTNYTNLQHLGIGLHEFIDLDDDSLDIGDEKFSWLDPMDILPVSLRTLQLRDYEQYVSNYK